MKTLEKPNLSSAITKKDVAECIALVVAIGIALVLVGS